MDRNTWELISWIATAVASAVAVVGVIVVVKQFLWQSLQIQAQAGSLGLSF